MKLSLNPTAALIGATLFSSLLLVHPAHAELKINNQRSEFIFVTTKAGASGINAIQEVQAFKKISGKVDDGGNISVDIEPGSVATGIDIRDQRLREMLFNTVKFPVASFSGQVNMNEIKTLTIGSSRELDLKGKITLCGQSQPAIIKVRVTKIAGDQFRVDTRVPFIVNAADFGIKDGVEALRKIMGLNLLSSAVPVSFSLVLN